MNTLKPASAIVLVTALLFGAAGCSDQNNQKVGERIDNGMETAKDKVGQSADTAKEKLSQAGAAMDDAAVSAKVKAKLMAAPGLKSTDIQVDTREGVVVLSGTVDKMEDAQRAVQLAESVESVISVESRLAVRSS